MDKIKKSNLVEAVKTLYNNGYRLIDPSKCFTDLTEYDLFKCGDAVEIAKDFDLAVRIRPNAWPSKSDVKDLKKLRFYNVELGTKIFIEFKGDFYERKLFLSADWDTSGRKLSIVGSSIMTRYKARVMSRNDGDKQIQAVEKAIRTITEEKQGQDETSAKRNKLKGFLEPVIKHFNETAIILICEPIKARDIDYCSDDSWASVTPPYDFKMGNSCYTIRITATLAGVVEYHLHKKYHGTCIKTECFDEFYKTVEKFRLFEEKVQTEFEELVNANNTGA